MPKRINPQDQWETDFLVPLPGEPRNIGPLEVLFQRLLNRTERLKNRIGAILGTAWDATPPATLAGLAGRVGTLESNQGGTTLAAHRTATTLDHPDGSVTSAKLTNGAVTTPKIADGAVTTVKLADGAVTAAKIADGTVGTAELADGAVTAPKIANNAVTTAKIADGAVTTVKLADGAVTAAKIADGTVGTAELADGAVTAPKIANNAVTTAKIADGAVTIPKLANASADPTPNAIVLRNAQGAVQDGVNVSVLKLFRVNGLYVWPASHKWIRLARWIGFVGNGGIFADLHILQGGVRNLAARLRARVGWDQGNTLYPMISLANYSSFIVVEDAVLVQTDTNNYELWLKVPTSHIYVSGVVGTNSGNVEVTPYGSITYQDNPPNPITDGIYLQWSTVLVGQTFPGPGYIVAASRTPTSGYVRYDNGIQVCWGIANVGNGTWTFPAAFASPPQVQATAETANAAPRVVTLTSVSPTAVGILRTDLSGNVQPGAVHLYAVGLWQ
jgi:hypothetical protein